jgi:hypothetical protein
LQNINSGKNLALLIFRVFQQNMPITASGANTVSVRYGHIAEIIVGFKNGSDRTIADIGESTMRGGYLPVTDTCSMEVGGNSRPQTDPQV